MSFPSGFLVIDKPEGPTSFSMVALVRRLTGVRRVGHAGTLDPLATGVLPIAVGQAARFIEYMDDAPKTYHARIRFGTATNTYDSEGTPTTTADASAVTRRALEELLPQFVGDIEQTPPAFSAIKVAGKRLYSYARGGESVELQPRSVHIERITILSFEQGLAPEAEIAVVCGKGTYIRSLAHDIGERLGVGAHVRALRRATTGGFGLGIARTPSELAAFAEAGRLESVVLAIDRAVERRRAAILASQHAGDVRAGRDITLQVQATEDRPTEGEICRAYDTDGSFMGVIRYGGGGGWHPSKVIPNA